jgi:hypothetical protein
MDLCSDIYTVIDPLADRELFDEFIDLKMFESDYAPSVTDASMTSGSASDSPSEHTRSTTVENSEVTSNAPSYDLDQDYLMQGTGANSRDHGTDQQSGLGSTPLLIPVLIDEHKQLTVGDRPASLPPSGGLVAPVTPVHLRSSRAIAPKPGGGPQPAAITSWGHGSPPRPPEVPQGKSPRPRTVFDPKKTAGVRAAKSCLHCSIHKLSVSIAELDVR